MREITIWERYNVNAKKWEHNHISDGFDEDQTAPIAMSKEQEKNWSGAEWQKFKAQLDGIKVVNRVEA